MTDQDEQYENHEESEYRFSDDYTDQPNKDAAAPEEPQVAPAVTAAPKKSNTKKMLISGAVFIVLVLVAYKVVVPSASTPSTNITPAQATAQATPQTPVAVPAGNNAQPNQTVAVTTAPTTPSNLPPPGAMMQQPGQAPAMPIPPGQGGQVASGQQAAPQMPASTQQNIPAVIPVQTTDAMMAANQTYAAPDTTTQQTITAGPQLGSNTTAQMASIASNSDRLVAQMQAQYEQKVNEFTSQNKQLQDQVQTLNSRMGTLETQLNQMMQMIEKQSGAGGGSSNNNIPAVQAQKAPDAKITFNVQAIIPGRAWLKSDNGETVTVAEGDVIHNLGKITKIDPYDGIVEINTGSKVVSLSYGNG